jgi:arsenate reductase
MLRIYTYSKCDTCKRALKFLRERNVAFEEISIRDTPPSQWELKAMATAYGDIRKLFNSSGSDYRVLGLSEELPRMSEREALRLLSKNGNLVKRPFLIGDSVGLVGFKLPEWEAAFPAEGTLLLRRLCQPPVDRPLAQGPLQTKRRFLAEETMTLREGWLRVVSQDGRQLSEANSREESSPARCDAMLKRRRGVGAE